MQIVPKSAAFQANDNTDYHLTAAIHNRTSYVYKYFTTIVTPVVYSTLLCLWGGNYLSSTDTESTET